jgi:MFS family permease
VVAVLVPIVKYLLTVADVEGDKLGIQRFTWEQVRIEYGVYLTLLASIAVAIGGVLLKEEAGRPGDTENSLETQPAKHNAWLAVVGACLPLVAYAAMRYNVGLFALMIMSQLGFSRGSWSQVPSTLAIATAVGAPLAGVLIDRFGVRITGLFFTLAFSFAYASIALTGGLQGLVSTWFLFGVAAAATIPLVGKAIVLNLTDSAFPVGIALWLFSTPLIMLLWPYAAGWMLTKGTGWRGVFLITAVLGIACAFGFVVRTRIPDDLRSRALPFSWSPAIIPLFGVQVIVSVISYFLLSFLMQYVRNTRGIDLYRYPSIQNVGSLLGVLVGLAVATVGGRKASRGGLQRFRPCAVVAAVLTPLGIGLALSGSPIETMVGVGLSSAGTQVLMLGLYAGVLGTTARSSVGLTLGLFSCVSAICGLAVTNSHAGQIAIEMGLLPLFICLGVLIIGMALLTRMIDGDRKAVETA